MKILGLCLAFLLGPPGWGTHQAYQGDRKPMTSLDLPAELTPTATGKAIEMQVPSDRELQAGQEPGALSVTLSFGLTAFLVLLSLYFYRISVELGREAMRRERLARCFVQRNPRIQSPPPIQGMDVEEVDSLLLQENRIRAHRA